MAYEDVERWQQRYDEARAAGPADAELVAHSELFDGAGLALDLACGRGSNALFLATQGYQTIAIDGAINCLHPLRQQVYTGKQDSALDLHCVVMDLQQLGLRAECADIICVTRYLDRDLLRQLPGLLKPNGLIFYKTFNFHRLAGGKHCNPSYVLAEDELLNYFAALKVIFHEQKEDGFTSYLGRLS